MVFFSDVLLICISHIYREEIVRALVRACALTYFLPVMPAAPSGVSVCEVIKKWRKVEGSAASQAFKGNRTAWLPYLAFPSPESSPWYPSRWACERLCRNRCQRQAERAAAESATAGGASGADPKGAKLPAGECLAGRGQLGGAWLSQDLQGRFSIESQGTYLWQSAGLKGEWLLQDPSCSWATLNHSHTQKNSLAINASTLGAVLKVLGAARTKSL